MCGEGVCEGVCEGVSEGVRTCMCMYVSVSIYIVHVNER